GRPCRSPQPSLRRSGRSRQLRRRARRRTVKARFRTAALALGLLVIALAGSGCPCTDSVVNSSPWLRWQIFALFGSGRLCDEMLKRGAPLRMSDGAPIVGRFYPSTCHSQLNDDRRTVTVQFSGDGYAYTP